MAPDRSVPPPSRDWRHGDLNLFRNTIPLQNTPIVLSVAIDERGVFTATVLNEGTTTLTYYSAGRSGIMLFQEFEEQGAWVPGSWDWCGTGKSDFELAPGEEVRLEGQFWGLRRERMLGEFTEKEIGRA